MIDNVFLLFSKFYSGWQKGGRLVHCCWFFEFTPELFWDWNNGCGCQRRRHLGPSVQFPSPGQVPWLVPRLRRVPLQKWKVCTKTKLYYSDFSISFPLSCKNAVCHFLNGVCLYKKRDRPALRHQWYNINGFIFFVFSTFLLKSL